MFKNEICLLQMKNKKAVGGRLQLFQSLKINCLQDICFSVICSKLNPLNDAIRSIPVRVFSKYWTLHFKSGSIQVILRSLLIISCLEICRKAIFSSVENPNSTLARRLYLSLPKRVPTTIEKGFSL